MVVTGFVCLFPSKERRKFILEKRIIETGIFDMFWKRLICWRFKYKIQSVFDSLLSYHIWGQKNTCHYFDQNKSNISLSEAWTGVN